MGRERIIMDSNNARNRCPEKGFADAAITASPPATLEVKRSILKKLLLRMNALDFSSNRTEPSHPAAECCGVKHK
jgi:hypothetical protein